MLKTRIVTALVLLAILLPVFWINHFPAFIVLATLFFVAAIWESQQLFMSRYPILSTAIWTILFGLLFQAPLIYSYYLCAVCVLLWAIRMTPSLVLGLTPAPDKNSQNASLNFRNKLLSMVYGLAILGCFMAITELFKYSPLYLLSVMTIVWLADIGAYFTGKAFGKHKLAPSISPGKSWEGAVGGWIIVLIVAAGSVPVLSSSDVFTVAVFNRWGSLGLVAVLTLMVAASVVGDLFESQLKRRAGKKDSSRLLPGHGGVLDRIDALIPVLPLAVLIHGSISGNV